MNNASTSLGRCVACEERANAITHGLGGVLSIIGLVLLLNLALTMGSNRAVICCTIYGVSLVLLYTSSTLLHSIHRPRMQAILHKCDHMAIFLLIAGTYTPFALIMLRGQIGWGLCITVWLLAMIGMCFKAICGVGYPRLSVAFYLVLGWIGLFAMMPLVHAMPVGGLLLLVAGGVAYSGGVPFFLWEALPFNHAIWHLFVLCGSICHFAAIYFYAFTGIH